LWLLRFTEIIFIFQRRDPFPFGHVADDGKATFVGGWRMNALEIFPDESQREEETVQSNNNKKNVEDSDEEECQDAGCR
jgi:hypothetical protein